MDQQGSATYLTARELAERIKYKPNVINNMLKDSVLIEGVHYFRPFGRRKAWRRFPAVFVGRDRCVQHVIAQVVVPRHPDAALEHADAVSAVAVVRAHGALGKIDRCSTEARIHVGLPEWVLHTRPSWPAAVARPLHRTAPPFQVKQREACSA